MLANASAVWLLIQNRAHLFSCHMASPLSYAASVAFLHTEPPKTNLL